MSPRILPSALLWVGASGVALGLAYAASPVTCWFLVAMAGLFAWAGRGLSPGERRWVWRLLAVAVALRLFAVAVMFLNSDPHSVSSFPWDGDGVAAVLRTGWMRSLWMGIPIAPQYFNAAADPLYGWTTSLYPLAYIQYLLGPAPYGIHVVNIGWFVATAILLYRLVRTSFGRESALVGLGVLLFLPTPFMWSVSVLKEPPFVFLLALALVAAVTALRARPLLSRVLALAALGVSVAAVDGVRPGGLTLVVVGLAVGIAGSVVIRRVRLLLLVPVLLIIVCAYAVQNRAFQSRVMPVLDQAAGLHIGHVRTTGHHYKLLDRRFYRDPIIYPVPTSPRLTVTEGARFVIRALAGIVVFPLPWQLDSWKELALLPQQILWYVLVVLAAVGLLAGLRRDVLVTCLLVGLASVGAAGIAINSGNFGTMVRHRDIVVPFVVWLSALGGVATLSRWTSRSRRVTSGEPNTRVAPRDVEDVSAGGNSLDHR